MKLVFLIRKISLLVIVATVVVSSSAQSAGAVSANDWRAGNMINDTLFTDGDGMTVKQIQTFLEQRLPYCDKWGQKSSELGGGTRAQYGASVGNPGPFTCITNYYEVPKTTPGAYIPSNNYGLYNPDGSTVIPAGSKSAAQLIYDAAQQYSINPKTLLIKLATESDGPLTSDEWPLKKQYYYAMGAYCPDSGPGGSANCNVNYSGFSMQIAESAKLLRSYLDGMTQSWWPYKKPNQTNHILWNVVERNCGGSNVFIETKATAALYTYTPYQPNAAALNNMYGTGDNCSAYGNRNFWRVWNDWFGSTQESGYTPFFQLPGSVKTYVFGTNNTYYEITDYAVLKNYGFETSFKQRIKSVSQATLNNYTFKGVLPEIARFENIGVYLANSGTLRPFPSEEILNHYGYTQEMVASLPKEMIDVLPVADPLWRIMSESNGKTMYLIENKKKLAFCNWDSYTKLGSPTYSTQPSSKINSEYLSKLSNGAPIAMDGDVIENWDTKQYGLWQGGTYIPMNQQIAESSNTVNCGAPGSAVSQLTLSDKKINNTVSDSTNKKFIIDGSRKLLVTDALLGSTPIAYTSVSDSFLNRLQSSELSSVVRINNGVGVYYIHEGKSYGIPTESDLFGAGYSFSQVQNITSQTFNNFPSNGLYFKPKSVVREAQSLEVYMIDSNLNRHYISSEDILSAYGIEWSDVRVIPSGSLAGYTKSSPLTYFVKEHDSLYWLMNQGLKYKVPVSLMSPDFYNLNTNNSTSVSVSVLSQYPMSTQLNKVFRAGTSAAVYVIENGNKRAFTSEAAFFAHGFKWSDVTSLSYGFVNSRPNGAYIYQ